MTTSTRSQSPELPTTPPDVEEVTASAVMALQAVRSWPCVSVLLTTTPAPRMLPDEAARLRRLADQAQDRLDVEALPGAGSTVMPALRRLLEEAVSGPTGTAIALFASAAVERTVRLPLPVRDRVVLDNTFATRDLVRALHRTPRHLVLALAEQEARLFEGVGDQLRPAATRAFPIAATDSTKPRSSSSHQGGSTRWLRTVDQALAAYYLSHPAPLVLVAAQRTASEFARVARTTRRLAGVVTGNHTRTPLPQLQQRIRPVLDDYLHRREQEALELLGRRMSQQRAVDGIAACWLAARHEAPEMLVVDPALWYPARVSDDGDLLEAATDPTEPGVVDDVVDELIELVLMRGGWIAFTSDTEALSAHEGVALTLRGR
ncbi:MAG: hypothetical protein ACRC35_13135 [Angustibacter sp.]